MSMTEIVKGMSKKALEEAAVKGESARRSLGRLREKGQESMGEMVHTMEAGVAAFGWGYGVGRYGKEGDLEIWGIPADLATGLGLKALSWAEQFDRYDADASAFGQGSLDAWLTRMGVRMGMEAKAKTAAATPAAAGHLGGVTAGDVAREMARSAGMAA